MKLRKRVVALFSAMVMAASMMSIGASASWGESWYLTRPANSPSSAGITHVEKTVYGLVNGYDTRMDFHCTSFSGGSGSTYARGDIEPIFKKYSSQTADLYYYTAQESVDFRDNWYSYTNRGYCKIYVDLCNYTGINGVTIYGTAS